MTRVDYRLCRALCYNVRLRAKCFTSIMLLDPHHNSVLMIINTEYRYTIGIPIQSIGIGVMIIPSYRWGNWGTEMLNNLPKITELVSGESRIHSRAWMRYSWVLPWFRYYQFAYFWVRDPTRTCWLSPLYQISVQAASSVSLIVPFSSLGTLPDSGHYLIFFINFFLDFETHTSCVTPPFGYPKGFFNSICQKRNSSFLQSLLFAQNPLPCGFFC